MAYQFRVSDRFNCLALDHCEDMVLLDAYLRVKGRIPPGEHWLREFEAIYLGEGKGLADGHLEDLNRHLRRCKIEPLEFPPTRSSPYSAARGAEKAERRRQILEDLKAIPDERRRDMIDRAQEECGNLVPALPSPELDNAPLVLRARPRLLDLRERQRDQAQENAPVSERLLEALANAAVVVTSLKELSTAVINEAESLRQAKESIEREASCLREQLHRIRSALG